MEKVEEKSGGRNSAGLGLKAICFGFFLVVLDTTALNVALGSIHRDLGGTITGLQWVVNSYLLPLSALLLLGGAAGDRFGRRRLLIAGVTLFGIASLGCSACRSRC